MQWSTYRLSPIWGGSWAADGDIEKYETESNELKKQIVYKLILNDVLTLFKYLEMIIDFK